MLANSAQNFRSRCRGHGSTASLAQKLAKFTSQPWSLIFTATANPKRLREFGNSRIPNLEFLI
nr:hypothetical protein [uncultured Campylobacter sp.]